MTPKRVQGFLFGGSLLLVAMVLLFSGFLNIGSFRNNYVVSLIGSYTVSGGEVRRQLEYSLKYGKSLENFAHIEDLLRQVPRDTPAIEAVSVLLPDGRIIHDLNGPVTGHRLPDTLRAKADFSEEKTRSAFHWSLYHDTYHAFLPIHDRTGQWVGTLDLQFDRASVDRQTVVYLRASAGYMLAVGLGALVLLALLLARVRVVDAEGKIQQWRFSILLICVLTLAQLAYGAVNIMMFHQAFPTIVQNNTRLTGNIIRKTVEGVVHKGARYEDLVGIEDWLDRVLESVPEIGRIDIETDQGGAFYTTDATASRSAPPAAPILRLPMQADATGTEASLGLVLSASYVSRKLFELALDAATMLVTSFFFMGEMIVFLGLMLKKRLAVERSRTSPVPVPMADEDDLVRPLAFLLLLSGYLSVSFIPVMMSELYEPLLGLSRAVVIGLPISAEMFGAFLSSLVIGHAIDRHGWRPAFLAGLAVFGLATALSGAATSALAFIAARGLVGLGYGAAWMGLRGLVAAGASGASRTKGFTVLNAGIFAGQNCGAVLGAMLAERFGFTLVFYLAAALVVFTACFALLLVRNLHLMRTEDPGTGFQRAKNFFGDRRLLGFLLLITIPSAVVGMFLNYFFPLYAKSLGVSQGDIGRTFLAYGVCIIYVGPLLIHALGNRLDTRTMMSLAGLIGVMSLAVFSVHASFGTAVAAIVLLGVSESIGLVAQNSYFVNLPAALAFGRGKALSIFSAIKKVGQMLGPTAFGLATVLGVVQGIALVAGAYLATTGAFFVISRRAREGQGADQTG